jgi:hypothetical protein
MGFNYRRKASRPDAPEPGDDDFLEYYQEEIKHEVNSDSPAAWVFQDLLESLDDE